MKFSKGRCYGQLKKCIGGLAFFVRLSANICKNPCEAQILKYMEIPDINPVHFGCGLKCSTSRCVGATKAYALAAFPIKMFAYWTVKARQCVCGEGN